MKLRILLLQARRSDDPAGSEERQSFAARLGLPLEQIHTHDLLGGPPTLHQLRSYDSLMVGGSGHFYVSKRDLYGFDAVLELMREVVEVGHPTFASCFGFQLMAEALGGQVVYDPDRAEVGTYWLSLTEGGKKDPLLGALPASFLAQMGHKDRVRRLPETVSHLAAGSHCQFQAFRIPGLPIWAFQFHPELNSADNRLRFIRYMDGYAVHMTSQEREEAMGRFQDSPETETLLPRFVKLVFD